MGIEGGETREKIATHVPLLVIVDDDLDSSGKGGLREIDDVGGAPAAGPKSGGSKRISRFQRVSGESEAGRTRNWRASSGSRR